LFLQKSLGMANTAQLSVLISSHQTKGDIWHLSFPFKVSYNETRTKIYWSGRVNVIGNIIKVIALTRDYLNIAAETGWESLGCFEF